jgi:hypothetical protein
VIVNLVGVCKLEGVYVHARTSTYMYTFEYVGECGNYVDTFACGHQFTRLCCDTAAHNTTTQCPRMKEHHPLQVHARAPITDGQQAALELGMGKFVCGRT